MVVSRDVQPKNIQTTHYIKQYMMVISQKLIVMGLGIVLVAGTLGFDWADTLFPSAKAHDIHEQLQSRFVRIEDETFNLQSMQTGDILTVQGRLVSLVDRDLRGWVSIFLESENAVGRLEIVGRDPPGNVFDIAGNSVVPYTVSARVLEEGVYHVHTQLNVATVGPGLGPGQTVVVEGEPITRPAPPDSTATAMPSDGTSDIPVVQIDPEAEAAALAEGYDLRQIANVSSLLPDLVLAGEILACEPGTTYISVTYVPHPSNPELPDHVVLVIQLLDSNIAADFMIPLLEAALSNITLDMVQGWVESDEFAEATGFTESVGVTDWTTDTLDAAGLGDDAFSYTIGVSVEGEEFHVQQIWFSRDRLVIFIATTGLSDEDTMAVAAKLDSRVAQVVRPDIPIMTTSTCEGKVTPIAVDEPSDIPIAVTIPTVDIGPYADLRGADLVGVDLRGASIIEADLTGASLQHANLTGASLQHVDLTGAQLQAAGLAGASLRGADLTGANLRYADLRYATLSNANLTEANLVGVDLTGADLRGADLAGANFTWAHLAGANLQGANLTGADLRGADLTDIRGVEDFTGSTQQ